MTADEQRAFEIAERVCTAAELQALQLERQGMSQRTIGHALGISREAVRDRLDRAARKVAAALDEDEG